MRWSKLIACAFVFDADSSEKFPTKLKMEWNEDSVSFMLRTEQESLTVETSRLIKTGGLNIVLSGILAIEW